MAGTVERVRSSSLVLKVIAAYLIRFPFTRDFFPDTPTPGPEAGGGFENIDDKNLDASELKKGDSIDGVEEKGIITPGDRKSVV